MVKVRWKFGQEKVYLEVITLGDHRFYWFPKIGLHKRFHPRQIFTRHIPHQAYRDSLIKYYAEKEGWIEGELEDKIVREKLGILVLTEEEYYDQIAKAC